MTDTLATLRRALAPKYQMGGELGRGGMSQVFFAHDVQHGRRVAIKVLDPEVAAAIGSARFLREIQVAASLQHPNIVPLLDSGNADGLLYFTMPLIEGESLRKRLARERQLPVEDAVRIAQEVSRALAYSHRNGVIHRDIKPENILISDGHAVVSDFGIAHLTHRDAKRLTSTGTQIGSPLYMSPEQLMGDAHVDGRSDVYSLGCVLYEMMCGQPPFTGPSESIAHQHLSVAPRPVREIRPSVPAEVDAAITKSLAKNRADRFASAADFASALGHEPTSIPAPVAQKPRPFPRRGLLASLAVVAAMTIAVTAALQSGWKPWPDSGPSGPKSWILVAEFEAPSGDSVVARTTRELLITSLEQSRAFGAVSDGQVRIGLEAAGMPTSTRLSGRVAHEIAFRGAVRAVLEGSIGRLGRGYAVTLHVQDADKDSTIFTLAETARSEDDLFRAVDVLGGKLRRGLGERAEAIRPTRRLSIVRTPSFEAYQLYVRGVRLGRQGRQETAIPLFKRALEIDPEFAAAWAALGTMHQNLYQNDSARSALKQALALPDRATDFQKLLWRSSLEWIEVRPREALAFADEALALDPGSSGALSQRALCLDLLERYDEALAEIQRSLTASPFGPSEVDLTNQAGYLTILNRTAEARELLPRMNREYAAMDEFEILAAEERWAADESLARALIADRKSSPLVINIALAHALTAAGARGAARQAIGELTADYPRSNLLWDYGEPLWLMMASGNRSPEPARLRSDTTKTGALLRGLWAAARGDIGGARNQLHVSESLGSPWPWGSPQQEAGFAALLKGWIALLENHPEESVEDLSEVARTGLLMEWSSTAMRSTARYIVAQGYEKMSMPDSSAAFLERILADIRGTRGASAWPFARSKLVLAYVKTGRLTDARRQFEILKRDVDKPDPEVARVIHDAEVALVSAEAMSPKRL